MQAHHLASAAAVAAVIAITTLGPSGTTPVDAGPRHFEVHEWGTFTSMQGPDGLWLEGLHHEEERLPSFVHDLGNTAGDHHPGKGLDTVTRVTRKMETPVIYFYTSHPMAATVDVRFERGLISQWYPATSSHSYRYKSGRRAAIERAGQPHDVAGVRDSHARWEVDLVPRKLGARTLAVPRVAAGDPWALARKVNAAQVRTRGPERETEDYLFYRGLGREGIALHATDRGGRLRVDNKTAHRINASFALEVGPRGARFATLGALPSRRDKAIRLARQPLRPTATVVAELRARVKRALIAEGLFADEAEAMVATWSRSWFASEGTRVIYVVPRAEVDRMLPIHIEPRPRTLVRAFIGRVEVITEEARDAIAGALERGDEARLARLGRFEEPYLRLLSTSGEGSVRALAARRLKALVDRSARAAR